MKKNLVDNESKNSYQKLPKDAAEAKNILQSKTIWGIIIIVLPFISKILGLDIEKELGDSYEILLQTIGSLVVLYGRWKANTNIVITKWKK